ncbi:hypothetical protein GCM10009639_24080 [Kitasatospora putterlickiae]|uniref:SnoaL-like domain-containing protein n=1 Tax=Kitasatospora putterlickiae TaxID=221725 RepID=A0ABP4IQ85_9ACTN
MTLVRQPARRPERGARTALFAAATAAAVALGAVTTATGATAGTTAGAGGELAECADVQGRLERLEGRLTPNACAFLQRQLAFGETSTGTPPAPGDLTHPRVRVYQEIFDDEATLWEAGGAPQRGLTAIGTSITRSLGLVPDFRYRGTEVVADGAVVMFGQWNEATVKGHPIAFPQIARNVLSDDGRTMQARRYYDRHELFKPVAPELRPLFAGVADPADAAAAPADRRAPERFRAGEITARLAAWNGEDVAALVARTGAARLGGPGLAAPLATTGGKADYLRRLFEQTDVRFKPGQVAFGRTMTYVEWHGTAVPEWTKDPATGQGTEVPFGIVERIGPGGQWELFFDTLPLIATEPEIGDLYRRLAQP